MNCAVVCEFWEICPETAWQACMCRQAVYQSLLNSRCWCLSCLVVSPTHQAVQAVWYYFWHFFMVFLVCCCFLSNGMF